jgi:hypothetical protein
MANSTETKARGQKKDSPPFIQRERSDDEESSRQIGQHKEEAEELQRKVK